MRKYTETEEKNIRLERLVREWTRSGMLEADQLESILPQLRVELRRTNLFIRLILFAFGVLIISASVLLVGVIFNAGDNMIQAICFVSALICFGVAEVLVGRRRLYRFGLEEAAVCMAVVLTVIGSFLFASKTINGMHRGRSELFALIVASVTALVAYLRFGYVYVAAASVLCFGFAPFETGLPGFVQRLAAAGIFAAVLALTRIKQRDYGDEFPGNEYSIIQALAWAGVYAVLNLHLVPNYLGSFGVPPTFYSFTYIMVWALPAVGIAVAVRDKDRTLLDVCLAMGLLTVISNKAYLNAMPQTWDPILFGVTLLATALIVRRWLSQGQHGLRFGFTASRILRSDKRAISMAATIAGFATNPAAASAPTHSEMFKPEGGRSGGAGATGSF
jgi:hypothetical protein